jgi:hypothetical protein
VGDLEQSLAGLMLTNIATCDDKGCERAGKC